ncbi:WLM-domain-containing protein [Auricularia subglabra TFB-10046 SS5]|nr:WLM-domain-containing protein [Auricularia subglabra TFB-10046 SS5]
MVHVRLNEREANPNQFINFISPLPAGNEDDARELLRALAAQVKPVMKDHGYTVNSFEEYEHNPVFLGRNWNAGETIEIVLRRPGGSFYPTYSLLNTLCHELAHITHMNHSRDFHILWAQLRREVEELQARGYFGDGMWSAGTRLGDGATVHQADLPEEDAPEYICGGAHKQSRQRAFRRRRAARRKAGPSNSTGPQTEKRGKPGRRIRGDAQFVGDGHAVNEGLDGDAKNVGIGFRKKAGSKSARDARAAAAERRLAQLTAGPSSKPDEGDAEETSDDDDDGEDSVDVPRETDEDRRQMLLESMKDDGDDDDALEQLRTANGQQGLVTCGGKRTPSTQPAPPTEPPRKKQKLNNTRPNPAVPKPSIVKAELDKRKREMLGIGQAQMRTVGTFGPPRVPPRRPEGWKCPSCTLDNYPGTYKCTACFAARPGPGQNPMDIAHDRFWMREAEQWDEQRAQAAAAAAKASTPPPLPEPLGKWICKICTLLNPPLAPLCGACETARSR